LVPELVEVATVAAEAGEVGAFESAVGEGISAAASAIGDAYATTSAVVSDAALAAYVNASNTLYYAGIQVQNFYLLNAYVINGEDGLGATIAEELIGSDPGQPPSLFEDEVDGDASFLLNSFRLWAAVSGAWETAEQLGQEAPDPPSGTAGDNGTCVATNSEDPNSMLGPAGYGSPNFVADGGAELSYQIDFENSPSATAPAQTVTITDQLDPNLDWSTFQLSGIGWGDTILTIPPGSQSYETNVPMAYNGQTFDVLVEAGIHAGTGQVYATFQSLDPTTQLPPDVLTGFLPPKNGTGRGIGYLSFMIQPNAGLATGTQIRNVALITFDQNPAIATDQLSDTDPSEGIDPSKQALITIDSGSPTSSVGALPATESTASFTVTWSGNDDPGGSGIGSYNVYVSDNGGPYTVWQSKTTQPSARFNGVNGHTYAFYSVSTDNVGNVQATPTAPQATTKISVPVLGTTTSVQASPDAATPGESVTFTVTVTPQNSTNGAPTGTIQFQIDGTNVGSAFTLSGGSLTVADADLAVGHHSITAIYTSDNGLFDPSTGTLAGGESVAGAVSVAVVPSASESQYGNALTFTASVSPLTTGLPAPSGSVQFEVDGTPFGAPVKLAGGKAVSPAITTIPAGTQTITAIYSNDPDYSSNSASTPETVAKASLTVTAIPQSMVYSNAIPRLTYAVTGFVNGESASVVSGAPTLFTIATPSSLPGAYPITVGVGTLTAANYTFTSFVDSTLTVGAPPLVTLTGVQEEINKKHQVTGVVLTFSGAVNATLASETGTYRLATPGKKGSYTAKNAGIIKLSSAVYSPSADKVVLTPRKPFALTKPVQVLAYGTGSSGLEDTLGRLIDGDHNGTAGGNAVAILNKKGATIDSASLARAQAHDRRALNCDPVDVLLERDDFPALSQILDSHRAARWDQQRSRTMPLLAVRRPLVRKVTHPSRR
jgi:hypothetical protein